MVVEAYTNGLSFQIWTETDMQIGVSRWEVLKHVNDTAYYVVYPKVMLPYRVEEHLPWL